MLYNLYEFIKNRNSTAENYLKVRHMYQRSLLLKEHLLLDSWRASAEVLYQTIVEAKYLLGPAVCRKLLTSPLISSQLQAAELKPEFYFNILQAELQKKSNRAYSGSEKLWTALGDTSFGGPHSGQSSTNDHIPLDFFSPWLDENDVARSRCYSPEEASQVAKKINEALLLIKRVDDGLYQFTCEALEVIQIRHTSSMYSYSTERLLGKVFFGCPIEHYRTLVGLACGIYHEAIHNHLYIIEKFQCIFTSHEGMEHYIVSPWSGNYIQLHSFCHAIYVWYALWAFSKLCAERVPEFAAEAHESAIESGFGFLKGVAILFSLQSRQKSKLDKGFILAVEEMQRDVQAGENRHFQKNGFCHLNQFLIRKSIA